MSVCVVVVTWNGWRDTIECLESLFRSRGVEFQVLVCDNDSADGSLDHVRAWAEGRLEVVVDPAHPLRGHSFPPIPKPVRYASMSRDEAERGGGADADAPLVLVQTGANRGFAGGCNVGIRFALSRGTHRYVWLLNNDTVVDPDALRALVDAAEADPRAGMIGSTLLFYDEPETVQALGLAAYNEWLALPRHVRTPQGVEAVQGGAGGYVVGASMLVPREFLEDVGLLDESYFYFFEELDWAARARGRWGLAHAAASRVFHKEGATYGGSGEGRSLKADYHFMKNRIVVTRRHFPQRLPSVYVALGVAAMRRALRGQWGRAWMILKLYRTT
ncbi:MAG TPA: glycosyltransferase family 2 protein [Longimicrobium sp.]|jgi:GT2 family glycosyltransferase|nr:glycosyltransferase family 2 protein [Longimicrobium sp.]